MIEIGVQGILLDLKLGILLLRGMLYIPSINLRKLLSKGCTVYVCYVGIDNAAPCISLSKQETFHKLQDSQMYSEHPLKQIASPFFFLFDSLNTQRGNHFLQNALFLGLLHVADFYYIDIKHITAWAELVFIFYDRGKECH